MSPPAAPHILVVDDDEGLLVLMAEALRAEGCEVATAGSARAARAALAQRQPDLMLLDLKLPDAHGPALGEELRREGVAVPFVIVTGQGDEKAAVAAIKLGALDYVMKDTGLLDLLPAVVRRALAAVASERALAAAEAEHRRLEREILAAGERERQAIGADLHDNLGQHLTALELMCAALKADAAGHPSLARGLDRMGAMLREAIAQTRFLARGLVPLGSEPDALPIGLGELAARIDTLGRVRCRFECPEPVATGDAFVAGHLYRIAQEAVNNALKHAQAGRITVRLRTVAGCLELEIADDGAGFTKTAAPAGAAGRGLGLGVMRHRAHAIGAELRIEPRRGGGTVVRCRRTLLSPP